MATETPLQYRKYVSPPFSNICTASFFPANSLKFQQFWFLKGPFLSEGSRFLCVKTKNKPPCTSKRIGMVRFGIWGCSCFQGTHGQGFLCPLPTCMHRPSTRLQFSLWTSFLCIHPQPGAPWREKSPSAARLGLLCSVPRPPDREVGWWLSMGGKSPAGPAALTSTLCSIQCRYLANVTSMHTTESHSFLTFVQWLIKIIDPSHDSHTRCLPHHLLSGSFLPPALVRLKLVLQSLSLPGMPVPRAMHALQAQVSRL